MLPKSVQPINYTLTLFPSFERFDFYGEETIDIEVFYWFLKIIIIFLMEMYSSNRI